jgi:hypothetical protein
MVRHTKPISVLVASWNFRFFFASRLERFF